MSSNLFESIKKQASKSGLANNNQAIITMGSLIRSGARLTGRRASLKKTRADLKLLETAGFFTIAQMASGPDRQNPFNRPLLITLTDKGRATIPLPDNKLLPARPSAAEGKKTGSGRAPSKFLAKKAQAVVEYLKKLCEFHKKKYCFPSQDTIMKYCQEWEGEKISKRTLNRILVQLEEEGWISRACRHKQNADGTWIFRSSLYLLTEKVFNACEKAVVKAKKFFTNMGLPEMANNLFIRKRIIQGGTTSEGASPPCFDQKDQPTAVFLSETGRQANLLRVKSLLTSLT